MLDRRVIELINHSQACSILAGLATASGKVTSMHKPLDGRLLFYWIVGQEANQNGGCFENYHHLRYLFSLCGVQKGQSFLRNLWKGSYGQ